MTDLVTDLGATPSPRARGSTLGSLRADEGIPAFPACAGIDPFMAAAWSASHRLPRVRGDRPGILADPLAAP